MSAITLLPSPACADKVASTTTVVSSLNPSTAGASVTFTATVSSSTPNLFQSVNFTDGVSSIPGCSAVQLTTNGNPATASCTTAPLSIGTHTIGAYYGGDANNVPSNAKLSQVVNGSGSCATGFHLCGAACSANSSPASCGATACSPCAIPANGAATCDGTSCGSSCDGGYKKCGSACIASAGCCSSTDCATPPSSNGCYAASGTCASNVCSYAYKNGSACNADSSKCTPNDSCLNGVCVADTAHEIACVQRDCHSAPACNPASGNCDDAPLTGGSCGVTGCYSAGVCSAGSCSGIPKDCSAQTQECKVGVCDATNGLCTASDVVNGTPCTAADKCLVAAACSGGVCVGVAKECAPSAPCRTSACNSSSGACEEVLAAEGTSCSSGAGCVDTEACDSQGQCICPGARGAGASADASTNADASTGASDLGAGTDQGRGCSIGGEYTESGLLPLLLMVGIGVLRARRRLGTA